MAIITCRRNVSRRKLLLVLAAISFISLALAVPQLIPVFREDDDVVHHSSDHFVTSASSQLSLILVTNVSTGFSFAQTSTTSPSIQPFTAQLTTTNKPEEGANRPANYDMPSEIRDAFKGMVPEKVLIPDGQNIHFSARTTVSSYANRFPVVFLTWFQTVPPHNVSRFQDFISLKLTRDNDPMNSCMKYIMSHAVVIYINKDIYIYLYGKTWNRT